MLENLIQALKFVEEKLAKKAPSVPRSSGEALNLIIFLEASQRERLVILEIGGAYGYSTLWMLKGIFEAGAHGEIYTIEIDEDRAKALMNVVSEYGLEENIKVIHGDASNVLDKWKKQIDIVFLDAEKDKYLHYLNKVRPYLRDDGIVIAHNVIDFRDQMEDFLNEIKNKEKWVSTIYSIDPAGLSVSRLKKGK